MFVKQGELHIKSQQLGLEYDMYPQGLKSNLNLDDIPELKNNIGKLVLEEESEEEVEEAIMVELHGFAKLQNAVLKQQSTANQNRLDRL
ncbi:hypothetical protein CDAR_114431 [Caerostris darwini]|uniref:Uncharacterized protein n=1 Tax=Caerostris darwini TaxID=1538125 RepID=A0AAV4QVM5_9ARAC|nr:hypothetical protein CDAR_114431 [Caerostris darwini]